MIRFVSPLLVALAMLATGPAGAQPANYPDKPVRLLVPYPTGGPTDASSRLIAERLTAAWGQSVFVENKPGATGQVGIELAARSPADGTTILVAVGSIINNELLRPELRYRLFRDFAPITLVFTTPVVLSVSTAVPATNLTEFLRYARDNPGKVSFGSTGEGSAPHIFSELINRNTGARLTHIPYAGEGPATTDLIGGHVLSAMTSALGARKASASGKTRMIAVARGKRSELVPDVPTFTEQGVPGLEKDSWVALFAPVGTPAAITQKVAADVTRILRQPDVRERFVGMGVVAEGGSPAELVELIRADTDYWTGAIRDTGLTLTR